MVFFHHLPSVKHHWELQQNEHIQQWNLFKCQTSMFRFQQPNVRTRFRLSLSHCSRLISSLFIVSSSSYFWASAAFVSSTVCWRFFSSETHRQITDHCYILTSTFFVVLSVCQKGHAICTEILQPSPNICSETQVKLKMAVKTVVCI